jgi:hypothetical protein
MISGEVYNLQERMEYLQRVRAMKWSEKMAELGRERSELGNRITSSLKEIEDTSGIFLIKPVYSYVSRCVCILNFLNPQANLETLFKANLETLLKKYLRI